MKINTILIDNNIVSSKLIINFVLSEENITKNKNTILLNKNITANKNSVLSNEDFKFRLL